jgi:hypothetical protein
VVLVDGRASPSPADERGSPDVRGLSVELKAFDDERSVSGALADGATCADPTSGPNGSVPAATVFAPRCRGPPPPSTGREPRRTQRTRPLADNPRMGHGDVDVK